MQSKYDYLMDVSSYMASLPGTQRTTSSFTLYFLTASTHTHMFFVASRTLSALKKVISVMESVTS